MFHRNLLGLLDHHLDFPLMVTESGTTCADPRSGSWLGRMAEVSRMTTRRRRFDRQYSGLFGQARQVNPL